MVGDSRVPCEAYGLRGEFQSRGFTLEYARTQLGIWLPGCGKANDLYCDSYGAVFQEQKVALSAMGRGE